MGGLVSSAVCEGKLDVGQGETDTYEENHGEEENRREQHRQEEEPTCGRQHGSARHGRYSRGYLATSRCRSR